MVTLSMKSIPALTAQHVADAGFVWQQRDRLAGEPHVDLVALTRHDRRLDELLAALQLDPELAWKCARRELKRPDPGAVFVAAIVAFTSSNQEQIRRVLKVGQSRPVASALAWLPGGEEHARHLSLADEPALLRTGIAALAVRRAKLDHRLDAALKHDDPSLRARAMRAPGELGDHSRLAQLRQALGDADPSCRFAAAWSTARLANDPAAIAKLQDHALVAGPGQLDAVRLAVRRLDPQGARRWLTILAQMPDAARASLVGSGALGDVSAVTRLLEAMKTPALARLAGEAFEFITGVHLVDDKLDAKPPADFHSGPTDDPADDNVALDPDENLPWPDAEKLKAWWAKNSPRFARNTRHLLGRPITAEWCRQVLRDGRQRQRAAAALELAILEPKQPLFNVRAPGFRQQAAL